MYLPGARPVKLTAGSELVGCLALQADTEYLSTSVVLCPDGHRHSGVIDLRPLLRYPDVLSLARVRAAQMSVMAD